MATSDKEDITRIRKKVDAEFESTTAQIEALIIDSLRRLDTLQRQIKTPVMNLIGDLDTLRERQIQRLQERIEWVRNRLHDLRTSLSQRLGMGAGAAKEKTRKLAGQTADAMKTAGSKGQKMVADTARAAAGQANTAAESARTATRDGADTARDAADKATDRATESVKSAAETRARADGDQDLTRIKGIGPVTARRLKARGIERVQQVAEPSPEDQKVLETFKTGRGLEVWQENARTVVANRRH